MNPTEISTWIRFGIQILLIPFGIYVISSLDHLNRQTDVMEFKVSIQINQLLLDHEQRLRTLEHQRLAESR